LRENKDNTLFK